MPPSFFLLDGASRKFSSPLGSLSTREDRAWTPPSPSPEKEPSVPLVPKDFQSSEATPLPSSVFRPQDTPSMPRRVSEAPLRPWALEAHALTRRYGQFLAVDRISLAVREGEIFGFLGPNGAGKSTLIQMLCGLLRPDAGEARLYGELVSHGPHVFSRIGICPQRLILWGKMTAFEQLVFLGQMYDRPRPWLEKRALFLLQEMGLQDKTHALAKTLSGGMQRRLNLLMALIHDPSILILDEPEAGLDPQSRVLIRDFIKRWVQHPGKTVILTSHDIDEVEKMADRVGILDRGRLLAIDTPQALKATVGQGDLLTLSLPGVSPDTLERLLFVFRQMIPSVTWDGQGLSFRHPDLASHLAAILELLRRHSLFPSDLRMRPNTLEDVFLTLTGRSLRDEGCLPHRL